MKTYSFYHKETGVIAGMSFSSTADDAALNTPPEHIAIEGRHDHLSKRVDIATSEVVDYLPPQPSSDHEWDAETKRWQLNAAVTTKAQARAAALAAIATLETMTARCMREALLGQPEGLDRVAAIDGQIANLRALLLQAE
jgi:hypothetical protein